MSNLSKKSLFLILLLVAVLALGAALALSFTGFNPDGALGPTQDAKAAISPNTNFGTLANGSKYYYTNTNGSTATVTVNTSSTRGSQTNPYVISSTAHWVGFINVITSKVSPFHGANIYFYLSTDLNFGGETIQPVGLNTDGFLGVLIGNKRTISNVKYAQVTDAADSNWRAAGLFYKLGASAKIFDLNLANNVTMSYAPKIHMHIGGIAAQAVGGFQLVSVSSNANITLNNGAATVTTNNFNIGGFIGNMPGSPSTFANFYYCSYKGTITATGWSSTLTTSSDNIHHIGGFVGFAGSSLKADACYIDLNMVITNTGINAGGMGGGYYSSGHHDDVSNTIIKFTQNRQGTQNTPDTAGIVCRPNNANTLSKATNVYVTYAGSPCYSGGGTLWGHLYGHQMEYATHSGVVTNDSRTGSSTTNSNPNAVAAGNSTILSKFNVNPDGSLSPKSNGGTYTISYDLGGGSWTQSSAAPKSYTSSFSTVNISQLSTKPTKAGFTFSKWSFDKSGSSTVTNSNTLPATMSGNKTIYAIWTVNGIGNPTSSAVTYGASSVSMSAATHAAVTNNLASISYQWRKGSGTGTVLA